MWLGHFVAQVLLLLVTSRAAEHGRLRKIPRIYNALITTDEELLPSQAYPAVSPVLHPTSHIFVEHKSLGGSPLAAAHSPHTIDHHQQHPPDFTDHTQPQFRQVDTANLGGAPPLIPAELPDLNDTAPRNVKNHRPADPAIPDVPPPPLPVSFKD